jgi:hypothetical protein
MEMYSNYKTRLTLLLPVILLPPSDEGGSHLRSAKLLPTLTTVGDSGGLGTLAFPLRWNLEDGNEGLLNPAAFLALTRNS